MPVSIPVGFASCAWQFKQSGDPDPWYCTCGLDLTGYGGSNDEAASRAFSAWATAVLGYQNSEMQLTQVILKIGDDGPPLMAFSTDAPVNGQEGSAMLPQNCAALVDKMSATGGRRGRGRFFVPSILKEGSVDNVGQLVPGMMTDIQNAFNSLLTELLEDTEITNGPIPPVILHSTEGGIAPAPTPITSFHAQGVISTQRRRLR